MEARLKMLNRGQKNQQVQRNRRPRKRMSENGPQQGHITPCHWQVVPKSLRYDNLKMLDCICLDAKCHNQNNRARKKPKEPKDRHHGRTTLGTQRTQLMDVNSNSSVQKKGHWGVNWTNWIMSESDNDITIKNVRKESCPIINSDKVWFWFIIKLDACGTPKQGSQQGANARPSTTCCQVDRTNPFTSSKLKLNTKESGGGVPADADKGTASDNMSVSGLTTFINSSEERRNTWSGGN